MENFFNNKNIFQLFDKWKKHVAIIVVSSIIIGIFISSPIIISPRFKSAATLYPVNLSELSKESKTEQMMQIIQSMDVNRKLIKRLKLGQHYKIDSTSEFFSNVLLELESNLSITKTEYEGVEIVAQDKNPQFACMLIDSLIGFYNEKVEAMHKAKNLEVLIISKSELSKKKFELDSLEKQIRDYRIKYGILDYKDQTKELTRGYVNMLANGKNSSKQLDTLINNLKTKGGDAMLLSSQLGTVVRQCDSIKIEYERNLIEYNKKITFAHVVSAPFPADKKSYPIRWLIILGFAVSSLILSFIGIAVIESRKK